MCVSTHVSPTRPSGRHRLEPFTLPRDPTPPQPLVVTKCLMAGSADYLTQHDRHELAVMPASLLEEVLAALDQGRRVAHDLPPVPERRDAEPPPQCVVGQREEPLPVDLGDRHSAQVQSNSITVEKKRARSWVRWHGRGTCGGAGCDKRW